MEKERNIGKESNLLQQNVLWKAFVRSIFYTQINTYGQGLRI